MPLEEVSRHTLLHRSLYMIGNFFWGGGGGSIFRVNIVGLENRHVVFAEGVGISPCKVVSVGGQRRHKVWVASGFCHGDGGAAS